MGLCLHCLIQGRGSRLEKLTDASASSGMTHLSRQRLILAVGGLETRQVQVTPGWPLPQFWAPIGSFAGLGLPDRLRFSRFEFQAASWPHYSCHYLMAAASAADPLEAAARGAVGRNPAIGVYKPKTLPGIYAPRYPTVRCCQRRRLFPCQEGVGSGFRATTPASWIQSLTLSCTRWSRVTGLRSRCQS